MNLQEILIYLESVPFCWHDIGKEIGVPEEKLQEIQSLHTGQDLECLSAIVTWWISASITAVSVPRTWAILVNILQRLQIVDVAEMIEANYGNYY